MTTNQNPKLLSTITKAAGVAIGVALISIGFVADIRSLFEGPLVLLLARVGALVLALGIVYGVWRAAIKEFNNAKAGIAFALCAFLVGIFSFIVAFPFASTSPPHQGTVSGNITSPVDTARNEVDVTGTIENLQPGQTLWLFVAPTKTRSTYLQWGPCHVDTNKRNKWDCPKAVIGAKDKDNGRSFDIILAVAEGEEVREFVGKFHDSKDNAAVLGDPGLLSMTQEIARKSVVLVP